MSATPALRRRLELALGGAAGVVVAMQKAGVTLLALLHAGVPTQLTVPLPETHRSLELQGLTDGILTAVREALQGRREGQTDRQRNTGDHFISGIPQSSTAVKQATG